METIIAAAFSAAIQLLQSVIAAQGGALTDEQMDQLANVRRAKTAELEKPAPGAAQ